MCIEILTNNVDTNVITNIMRSYWGVNMQAKGKRILKCSYTSISCVWHEKLWVGSGCDVSLRHYDINTPLHVMRKRKRLGTLQTKKFSQTGMLFPRKVFGKWVSEVILAFLLIKIQLLLLFPIFEPVVFHVNTFCSSLFQRTINESFCGGVVYLY